MARGARALIAALGVLSCAGACSDRAEALRMPPPLAARAVVLSISGDGGSRVIAAPIEGLDGLSSLITADGGARTFAVRFYDETLEQLGLSPGDLAPAASNEPSRPIPPAEVLYVAKTDGERLHGWVAGGLVGDPETNYRIACAPGEHDGGGGRCAASGACLDGYYLALDGFCNAGCSVPGANFTTCEPYTVEFTSEPLGRSVRARLGDVDGDGIPEIVATAYNQAYVYRVDGLSLRLESSFALGAAVQAAWGIGVGDTDGDGVPQVIVGTWMDDLFDLGYPNKTLALNRRISRQGYGNWTIEVGDFHSFPGNELLVSDRYGYFRALHWDGTSYVYHWTSPRIGAPTDTTGKTGIIGVGDTDGDGLREVATYSTQGYVDLWEVAGDAFSKIHHVEFPAPDDDGKDDFRGALGDADGDGRDDLFYADRAGNVHGLTFDGTAYVERWTQFLDVTITTMAVGDVDADPQKELVVGTEVGRTIVIDLDTKQTTDLDRFATPSRWVVTADLDGDTKQEIVVGYDDGFFRVHQHR